MELEIFNDKISQGITLMTEEKYEPAKKCFEEAICISAKSLDAYIHLGNACANLQQYDEAIVALKKVLIIDSNYGEAYFSIGSVYVLKDDKLKAVEYYNKAEEHGYQSSQMYQIMASIFFEADDVAQALRNIGRAINMTPFDGALRLFKARIHLAFNQYEQALDTLDEMEKILPDAFEAYDMKAQILVGQHRYEDALHTIEKGCERFPDDANLAVTKLRVLVASDRRTVAYEWIYIMKERHLYEKNCKDAAIQEATLLIQDLKTDRAYEVLSEANNRLHNDVDILYLIIDLCAKTSKYEEVLRYSEALLAEDCGDFYKATAMFFHATALDESGKKEEAQKEFKNLTSTMRRFTINNPSFYEGYLYRLLSHVKVKEYDKALELADYVHNLYPDKADAHAFRYYIYKEMGNTIEAEKEKSMAKEMNPNLDIQ